MPPIVLQIVSYIQLAMKAAPFVKQVYEDGKALIQRLFQSGLITAEQQNVLHKWADDHMNAVLAGQVPPELTVQPDPQ